MQEHGHLHLIQPIDSHPLSFPGKTLENHSTSQLQLQASQRASSSASNSKSFGSHPLFLFRTWHGSLRQHNTCCLIPMKFLTQKPLCIIVFVLFRHSFKPPEFDLFKEDRILKPSCFNSPSEHSRIIPYKYVASRCPLSAALFKYSSPDYILPKLK